MTTQSARLPTLGQQLPPQATQPPAQPGEWVGQGGSDSGMLPTPTAGAFLGDPPDWFVEAERRQAGGHELPSGLSFHPNAQEKAEADTKVLQLVEVMSRSEEAKARQEEAKTERARLSTGVPIPPPADPSAITLEIALASDTATVKLEYLLDPYLPRGCVVCFAGRGSTAKSSFLATIAAHVSQLASTLWVSVEEPRDWIKVRHIRCGGLPGTLVVVKAVASKTDQQGRTIASSFNIYEHLEGSIVKAKQAAEVIRPVRLIVLDTAVGLTGWAKGESPNDDAAVKKLLGYLQSLAERHDVTIAFIQHSNKGKHDHFADTVAGASAWTNSPRLSFVHARDRREEHAYVVRVAKSNLTQSFATTYTTIPVHTLHERTEGADSVLCRVQPGPITWGEEESMALYDDATRKPKDDDDGGGNEWRPPSLEDKVLQHVVEAVYATTGAVTRDMVHEQLGRSVHGRVWKRVDDRLRMAELQYKIIVDHGQQNRTAYQRRPEPAVPPPP